ncbi:hypothetical protein [Burkholderia ubonensis]|uniref:hypothetical protein n=1 Tax=Burkholderia ubonensis TaxID=101571 RepID=UPI000754FD3A|nr:hypothetical protein [Burkholderia ubonensis]KVP39981.1 hypothetical protein WJ87_07295 [Burkholderia ubonensis]
MLKQQLIIDVQGSNQDELAAAIKAAGSALATGTRQNAEDREDANFSISRGPLRTTQGYSPNTLYVVGTDATGKVILSSMRSSFDAHKDHHIMEGALELSQAVELRGVEFEEHKLGSLMVRPVPKAKPPRTAAQIYELTHITDLAKLDDEDIGEFVHELPGLIATLKFAKDECDKRGTVLSAVLPKLQYVADSQGTMTLNSESASTTVMGSDVIAGWKREQAAASGCTSQCKVIRDEDAPQHGCCQT